MSICTSSKHYSPIFIIGRHDAELLIIYRVWNFNGFMQLTNE